ncbi:MAG: hypothetical protein H6811_08720 [Phycisphaeraceae bacterium]|nr:hypothetical protein [Phycisphaeraceae bacterium]
MPNDGIAVENGLDLVLLLLYAQRQVFGGTAVLQGTTRLQKLLFLLWKEGQFDELVADLYNFKAYDFGPCLDDVYDDLDFAESVGLLKSQDVPLTDAFVDADGDSFLGTFQHVAAKGMRRRDFTLTPNGQRAAHDLWESLSPQFQQALATVVHHYAQMPIRTLLKYVYSKYPKFAENSKIADSL